MEAPRPFRLHFGLDGWQGVQEREAEPLGLGMWGVRLEAQALEGHASLEFTRLFPEGWEGRDHRVLLEEAKVS